MNQWLREAVMDLDKVLNADQTDIVTARERFCRIVPRCSHFTTEFIKQTIKGEGGKASSPYIYKSHCL
jgi:putative component of membrane protein insertase Oxa1/YidC/SpoIIIJ protein YidD